MITVFTPTYNRAYIIDNLYRSLLSQTDKDFEWVVVDDGSTDDTAKYFEKVLKNDNGFNVTFVSVPNGGKHRAINKGVTLAKGEMFFIVDSDDYLTADAIEKIKKWKGTLPADCKWAGVSGARGYANGRVIGQMECEGEYVDATNLEREKKKLLGDKAEVYFTDVLRKYPFPEFENEKFLTEEVVWNKIAYDGYQIRWFKDIIYVCEYIEDGLTKSGDAKYINNPRGVLYWAKQQTSFFKSNKKRVYSAIYRYYIATKQTKTKKQIRQDLGVSALKLNLAIFAVKTGRFIKRILRKN
ncbi:MAG: glycosyltransferase family 2 protein [Clostridia bacterium]|nr:glycosyltransferase family 2 protein [Clostridia bacterium]MBQ7224324.1 glycosyltransferase family 2 protein [Clostridia bacterium]